MWMMVYTGQPDCQQSFPWHLNIERVSKCSKAPSHLSYRSSLISMMLGELTVPWILIGWFLSLSQTLTDTHTLRAIKCIVKFDVVFDFGKEVHKRKMEKRMLNYTRWPRIKCLVLWDYVEVCLQCSRQFKTEKWRLYSILVIKKYSMYRFPIENNS